MAEPLFDLDVDRDDLLAALERLGDRAEVPVKEAAYETAQHVQTSARARARRRTGTMAEAITIEEAPPPLGGFRVFVGPMREPSVYRRRWGTRPEAFPIWHEYGTARMTAQPFLTNSAREEEGPHLARVEAALQDAIDEEGIGG